MKQILQKYLSGLDTFNKEEIDKSISLFEVNKLSRNDFFVAENKYCNHIAFIAHGAVRAFTTDPGGEENITCFKFENRFVTSYECFAQGNPSKSNIQAIEDCYLLQISFTDMNRLLSDIPAWKSLMDCVIQQEFIEKENYLINFKNKSAQDKYVHILEHSPEIINRVGVAHIASYLGVTQRTLTRVRKSISHQSL